MARSHRHATLRPSPNGETAEAMSAEPVPPPTFYERAMHAAGVALPKDAHILDFCCGTGADVYRLLDRGYRYVHGYDRCDTVERRSQSRQPVFRFDPVGAVSRLPFPDHCFNFIFSNQVLEHVQDIDHALAEISRCLKPGGVSLHVFPSKWRLIECHINVPLGGVVTSKAYYRLWAALGVRNRFQAGLSAKATAEANARYAHQSLNYLGGAELARLFARNFDHYRYLDLDLMKQSAGWGRYVYPLARVFPPILWLYRFAYQRIVMLYTRPMAAWARQEGNKPCVPRSARPDAV